MKHSDFVHLHNHSDFSLLDGASPIPRMVARAAELKMPALALTDHGSMFGAVQFYQAARKAGVKPIVGMEAYVTRGHRSERKRDTAHHLVLLCRDERGFRNLMKLSSLAFLEGFYYRPRVDHEILAQHAEGLLALSACPKGEVATDLLEGTEDDAVRTAGMYREIFGADHYFLEMQNHGLDIEDRIRSGVERLARRTGIPIVATNDCHYLKHEDSSAHDVLLCIQTGKNVDDANRLRYETDQVYFKSAEEMKALFAAHPQAVANTLAIAERCNLQLDFGKPLLPAFPLPEGAESPEQYLRDLAWSQLRTRYGELTDTLRERMAYELDVICRMGFASYFLIVRDFIDYARSRGIGVGPGRGSVAGSLVAYALRITDIDPIEHQLIFERFLNPERVTMPDIDIDFDDLRRGEVIEYVKEKYGEGNVTQIITFGTMGAKGVIRDVGRALGMAFSEVDRIAKLVPEGLGMTLDRALELSPDLKGLPKKGPPFDRLLKSAITLEGLARHASTHAAGVLITPGPLMDYVPLYRQKDDSITTQWDMKSVEKAGLLKMDFLGLRTLSVLAEAVALVKRHHGVEVDIAKLPMDDADTYRVFQNADTVAIFQFESAGMRDYLRRLKPTVFADLTAMNALYRPGPMENIPYFIDCKHGRQVAKYDHPALEPILKDTYGVFVYQEQVMAAAHALAGFSMAQGDMLRRAMGKKLPEEMDAQRKAFVEGCRRNGIQPARAEKIFGTMERFAGYGFNKCLVGSTRVMDADSGKVVTIEKLYALRPAVRVHAMDAAGKLAPRRVQDVVWNGREPVFELETAGGMAIRATANHPFRSRNGWRMLGEMAPGDEVATMPGWSRKALRDGERGFVTHEGTSRSVAVIDPPTAVVATSDVHWDRIVSIEPAGVEDTYDLTVEGDHNFVANGLVVHNSHSAAYALVAYQSAYFKAHYPAEFMAATLTSEMSDSTRIVTLIEECRRMGLEILPPDVNASAWKFTIEDRKIRYGLGAVRNVGQNAVESIVAAREAGGAFSDLFDLARRLDSRAVNRRVLESLVAAGACDAFGLDRGVMAAGAGRMLEHASALQRERESGQSSLFGDGHGGVAVAAPSMPEAEPWSHRERSAKEKEALGFYFSDHPLAPMRDALARVATHTAADAQLCEDGTEVRLAGLLGEVRRITTRSGKQMAAVQFEDLTGRIEVTLFPDAYETHRERLVPESIVCLSGRIEVSEERGSKLLLSNLEPFEAAQDTYRPCLHIEVRAEALSETQIAAIDEVLCSHGGPCEVYLHIVKPDHSRLALRSKKFRVSDDEAVLRALRERVSGIRIWWGKGAA